MTSIISFVDWINRFTDAEYALLWHRMHAVQFMGPNIQRRWDIATATNMVDLDDPIMPLFKAQLVVQGIISVDRADEIFAPPPVAPSNINVIGHGSGVQGRSLQLDTTGADLFIYAINYANGHAGSSPADFDSNGNQINNVWTMVGSTIGVNRGMAEVYYCVNPIVLPDHLFGPTDFVTGGFCVLVVSGAASSPFDGFKGAVHSGDDISTTRATGSILPSSPGELFVAFLGIDNPIGSVFSIDSNFTILDAIDAGSQFGALMAYKIQSGGATAENPTLTRSVPTASGCYDNTVIASFKSS